MGVFEAEIGLVIGFFPRRPPSLKSAFLSTDLSGCTSCPSALPFTLLLGPPNGPGSPVVSPNNCH